MYKIIFFNNVNSIPTDIINYSNNTVVGSFSKRPIGKFYITKQLNDVTSDIEDVIQNKEGIDYIERTRRRNYLRFIQEAPFQLANTIRNINLCSDIWLVDKMNDKQRVHEINIIDEKNTEVAGIKLLTIDILLSENILLVGGKYS